MLKTRILSALVMAPPTLAAVYFGEVWFLLLMGLTGGLMGWEWVRLCRERLAGTDWMVPALMALAGVLGGFDPLWVITGLLAATLILWGYQPSGVGRDGGATGSGWVAVGLPYWGIPLVCLAWIRQQGGWETAFWLLAVVWATDIGAYAFGRLIGGPKLAPRLSPKKTWAGLIGGMACALAFGWGVAVLIGTGEGVSPWLVALAPVLAVVAQAGDLMESGIKRRFDVKDSSNIIPGHGGILDRVDGLMAIMPVVALVMALLGGEMGL
ncbi:MAG: phosphatidate cytidylyltransferase [Rhodospirillum sp.]|nr:phosphatidate cytidylyltransferase [Rhodospirillum sp.]MCF8488455.1 phosphatidate cytidylyltransferase [Rhodospirillum sp.]MCF8499117.1 phosphatidate cytidylyltransferase [Rhodospirillum sp.]